MVSLTHLPPEIVHAILSYVDPEDLAVLPRTCHFLRNFVAGNSTLSRDIYYRVLDDPPSKDLDWVKELRDLVRLQTVCSLQDVDKRAELPFVHATVTRLLRHASGGPLRRSARSVTYPQSRNATLLTRLFESDSNREAFLSRSFIFERARGVATYLPPDVSRDELHQQGAELHSLFGMPLLKHGRTRSSSMYPFACSKVYDLREHTRESGWGPFRKDGSFKVDWEKVEAILLVLHANIKGRGLESLPIFANFWNTPFAGSWAGSYLTWPLGREKSELERQDPYDVSGTWLRVVCFLDYNDFFGYNFPFGDQIPDNVPRPALDTGEATRLILMKIRVTEIEQPGEGDDPRYPIVHFKGFSRSMDRSHDGNANSDLRGTARMTPWGEVRWTTYSIFSGEERWKSEGIQLGGIRSARGVVGNWFDKDYDPHGPCGPTAFWKISDGEPGSDTREIALHDFLPSVVLYPYPYERRISGGDDH